MSENYWVQRLVEATTAKGQKRICELKTTSKRQGATSDHAGEATRVPVEDVRTEWEEDPEQQPDGFWNTSVLCNTGNLENKYQQLQKIGEGSCGRIYAGYRRSDGLPVAIKFLPLHNVNMQDIVIHEKTHSIPMEVLIMHRMAGGPESTAVSLVEWFQQDEVVVLVIERPVPCVDLMTYMEEPLREHQNKNIMKQLVDAAIEMSAKGVFHGDIMASNILVETGSDVPRVRIIDFGCSCLVGDMPLSGVSDYYKNVRQQAGPITVEHLGLVLEKMLDSNPYFDSKTNIRTSLTQGCRDFLEECKDPDPDKRATLEQLKEHPWIN